MKNKLSIIIFSVFLVFLLWGIIITGNRGNLGAIGSFGVAACIVAFILLATYFAELIYKKFIAK